MKDQDDIELLIELLGKLEWHNSIDILVHLRNEFKNNPIAFSRLIQNLLLQGYDPEVQTQETTDSGDNEEAPKGVDWKLLLSQYCRTYPGKEPYSAWNEIPFPFFMEMLPEARQEEARRHIYSAFEASFAMGGSKEMMESWKSQAGWDDKKKAPPKKDRKTKELTEEQLQRNREKMKNLFNRS